MVAGAQPNARSLEVSGEWREMGLSADSSPSARGRSSTSRANKSDDVHPTVKHKRIADVTLDQLEVIAA